MSGGPQMVRRYDRTLRMAQAYVGTKFDALSPKEIQAARHMANDGALVEEIITALGWQITVECARRWFKKLNITPGHRAHGRRIRLGDPTTLPPGMENFDQRTYRPRMRA